MSVINRPQQQVLSLCLLLTANYDALQVCPTNHTCNQQLIQYQSLFLSTPSPLLSLQYTSSTFRGVCLLSDTHTHTHSHGNVIRSTSSCGCDSVYQLCHSPPGATRRAAGTRGWRKVKVNGIKKRKGMC